ncbi:hypothetical protein COCON_G00126630 [Conger conger]|uniref:Uncharacterized protein n=1 Tax=Conger conger TaxID=82655 RepID=A0A9Q1HWQ9_CONCO|nr:hypothetical protein COCON_G00126630 [Conger conger]
MGDEQRHHRQPVASWLRLLSALLELVQVTVWRSTLRKQREREAMHTVQAPPLCIVESGDVQYRSVLGNVDDLTNTGFPEAPEHFPLPPWIPSFFQTGRRFRGDESQGSLAPDSDCTRL